MSGADERYNERECEAEFAALFPRGFAGSDVLSELAPTRWETSPLVAVFHPSLEQVYEETVRVHRNIESFRCKKRDPRPDPTFAEIAREFRPTPIEPKRELRELVGKCVWDIFSDNHEVFGADGRVLDLGSFRDSGGFIADFANRDVGRHQYDYIDFYMGSWWLSQRADLTPVYEMIFRRLKTRGLDWRYHLPRLYLIDMRPLRDTLAPPQQPDWAEYSPEESFAKEQENAKRDRELAELREQMEEDTRRDMSAVRDTPPPPTVAAYRSAYGRFPEGWPPRE